jgi:FtsP/CotA-like multicopper oxidase with cupredoxin domain
MVRIGLMAKRIFVADRRSFLAGLGAAASMSLLPRIALTDGPQHLALRAAEATLKLRPGQPETPVWALQATPPALRFKPGQLDVALRNDLPLPAVLNWHGIDGVPAAEPLIAQTPLAPGASASLAVTLRRPGTSFCNLQLLSEAQAKPSRPLAAVVEENEPPTVDLDEVLLIEDWRFRADGAAIAPGTDPQDAAVVYTVNGQSIPNIAVQGRQRLRLRLISGCQRTVVAVKFEGFDVRVIALDGAPAEPFAARNGAVVLAPGGRADILIDVTTAPGTTSPILLHDGKEARPIAGLMTSAEPPVRPTLLPAAAALPTTGLPAQLDLKNALRVELALGGPEWVTPQTFAASTAPAFQAKAGRTVVLTLTNRTATATVFHLHGHHCRLLDRLDDGWKPYWLDTLAVEPGQTQRVAFAAEYAGRWLIESVGTDWTAPRLLRSYHVG